MPADCDGQLPVARGGMAARALLVCCTPSPTRDKAKSGKKRSTVPRNRRRMRMRP
jgi:hypothetical protein